MPECARPRAQKYSPTQALEKFKAPRNHVLRVANALLLTLC